MTIYTCRACKKEWRISSDEFSIAQFYDKNYETKEMFCSTACVISKRKKHKFNAKSVKCDEIKFSSLAERNYYLRLKHLQSTGEVLFFLRQVPFHLPGGIVYRLDFMEFWAQKSGEPGDIIFTEVKGVMTDSARIKISQTEDIYNIHINVVK